jgi:transcriptional regulator with XRE-family HTH domain
MAAPKPNSPSLSQAEQQIAARLAALRKEAGLTLRELGELTGLSDAYLSRLENGQTAVTIANLGRLAEAFSTPLASFFREEQERVSLVLRRAGTGREVRFRGRAGTLVNLLAEERPGKLMEPLLVDVASAPHEVPPQAHPGEEFNYVLEGRCQFIYGRDTYILEAGDSVYFDATVEHAAHAIGGAPCRLLAIVTAHDQQFHRNISKVLERRIQA